MFCCSADNGSCDLGPEKRVYLADIRARGPSPTGCWTRCLRQGTRVKAASPGILKCKAFCARICIAYRAHLTTAMYLLLASLRVAALAPILVLAQTGTPTATSTSAAPSFTFVDGDSPDCGPCKSCSVFFPPFACSPTSSQHSLC
jgi:hypothetical protein